jgi:hypothetical protein
MIKAEWTLAESRKKTTGGRKPQWRSEKTKDKGDRKNEKRDDSRVT